jgi:hypothetical protein
MVATLGFHGSGRRDPNRTFATASFTLPVLQVLEDGTYLSELKGLS